MQRTSSTGRSVQATYDSANHKITTYAAPATTATRTPEAVPQAAAGHREHWRRGRPDGRAARRPGLTDYLYTQIRTTASATSGTLMTNSYRYEEVG